MCEPAIRNTYTIPAAGEENLLSEESLQLQRKIKPPIDPEEDTWN